MQLCSVIPASSKSFTKLYIFIVLCHLFLSNLPTSSAEEGKPSFTEEPVDSLNVIKKSATLKCKVKSALNAWFECTEDETNIQRKSTGSNYVDPSDGVRHIELQLELFRKNKEFFSPFQCWCNAYGAHQTIESRRANLQFTASMEPEEAEVEQPKPVDGGWSPWSTWSACSHECQQVRRRYCTHPSPKYGGQHCFGSDTHIRNCTTGLCRKLDMYQQKREKDGDSSSKSGRSSPPRDLYLFAIIATATFLFLLVLFILLIFRRRSRQTKHEPGYIPPRGEDGHGIHLLLQQQQQQAGMNAMTPDLIRGGSGGDKMQLISRLNNFDSNVLEHLVIRNEHLQSASPLHQQQLSFNNTANVKGVPASINLTCANHSSSSNNNHVIDGSMNSVHVTTPMHRHAIVHSSNTEASSDASSDGDHSEPDYAEPMIAPSPAAFTPERKPPLPRSCPPNRQNGSQPHPDPTRRLLSQQQESHQGSRRKNRSSANRPSTQNPRYNSIESSSNSS